jgi:uroporphyrinogen III methyltransferase/synthase
MRLGAVAILLPTIEILPPNDAGAALDAAVREIADFDWVVLSSANAVDAFFAELPDARALAGVKIAVIGDRTAAAVRSHGVIADLVPDRFSAEGLAEVFPDAPQPSSKVLVPRAALAREILPDALRAKGWTVETPTAYETVHPLLTREQRRALVGAHVVTFASSSAVTGLLETVGIDELPPVVASIGPATTATLAGLGIAVAIEAPQHTMASLLDELVAYAAGHPTSG